MHASFPGGEKKSHNVTVFPSSSSMSHLQRPLASFFFIHFSDMFIRRYEKVWHVGVRIAKPPHKL